MKSEELIRRVWSFCHALRDDGISYGDYLEQLSFLLFLKLGYEFGRPPHNRDVRIPAAYRWDTFLGRKGAALIAHYNDALRRLQRMPGMLGAIFVDAKNKIQDPAKLARLIQLIDAEKWLSLDVDVKGDLYEGLLQKNAEDTKSGAGQYFTPRPLIDAIVACVQPMPCKTIVDPACGTGGFFLGAHRWLTRDAQRLTKKQKAFLNYETFFGNEIVSSTRRLCLMNMFLHDIGDMITVPKIACSDALLTKPKQEFDYVLANPPFGKKSTMASQSDEGRFDDHSDLVYRRSDFWCSTSNKQLNFVQHAVSIARPGGEVAIVVPDNVLFEGGVGEKIRQGLLDRCVVHTLLRLPTGIFYAQGVKANVLFFKKQKPKSDLERLLWIYDLRTNAKFSLRSKPLQAEDLAGFVKVYQPQNMARRRQTDYFRSFSYDELRERPRTSFDIFWRKEHGSDEGTDRAESIAQEIVGHLETALEAMKTVLSALSRDME
ncbi:MAG: class I SAM-dependent DNA methyltransferase [Rhizomicrobium sp.]